MSQEPKLPPTLFDLLGRFATLKRHDPANGKNHAGKWITLNVPVELMQEVDAAIELNRANHIGDAAEMVAQQQDGEAVADGERLIVVDSSFDALFNALERAASKDYMPDAMKDEWERFEYKNYSPPPSATSSASRDGGAGQVSEGGMPTADELMSLIPGTYYLDPPDGNDVSVIEQLRRMAEDAKRYRHYLHQAYLMRSSSIPSDITEEAAKEQMRAADDGAIAALGKSNG